MSRIDRIDDEVKWTRPVEDLERRSHPDYNRNLESAKKFIAKTEKALLNGMGVTLADSHGLTKSLLMISWIPPKDAPVGNFANPISLHQSSTEMSRQVEQVFNVYMKKANDYQKRFPKQPEFLDTTLKV